MTVLLCTFTTVMLCSAIRWVVVVDVLVLDDDPFVCPPHTLMSGVYDAGSSISNLVVTNDHTINLYRPTLTVAIRA